MRLPGEVAERIRATWAEEGLRWIEAFPSLLDRMVDEWQLSDVVLCADLSYSFVAYVRADNGETAVLKLGYPDDEAQRQASAMSGLNQCARVYRSEPDVFALLLERIEPGTTLWSEWSPGRDDSHTSVLGGLMRSVPGSPHGDFPSTRDWCRAFDRYLANPNGSLPERLVEDARHVASELHQRYTEEGLLHGDLHHGNVLDNGGGWAVIDAKGVIGEPAFEAGTIIRNPSHALTPTLDMLDRRLAILSESSGLELDRLRAWAFSGCALSSCWSAEANEDPGIALECAGLLSPGRRQY